MAAGLAVLRRPGSGPAIAGAAVALTGSMFAIATLGLTLADRQSAPPYTLAGLDVSWSLGVRTLVEIAGLVALSLICGAIVWHRPRALLSLLFLGLAVSLWLQVFAPQYAVRGLLVAPGSLPLADVAAWSQKLTPAAGLLAGAAFALLFPDGRLKSSRWRILMVLVVAYVVSDFLIGLDDPYPLRVGAIAGQSVPVTLPPMTWPVGASLSFAAGAVGWIRPLLAVMVGAYLILRLQTATGEVRLQLKWFVFAAAIFVATVVLGLADNPPPLDWLPDPLRLSVQQFAVTETAHAIGSWSALVSSLASAVLLPAAIGVAMVRYRLYDIDVVINRTILYGGLALFVTAAYAMVVAGVGSLLGQRAGLSPLLSLVTIALLAALLLPVRSRLQALANRAVYGNRARPYDVLSDFAEAIAHAEPAEMVLPRMAELLRDGTGAVSTEVWVKVTERLQLAASAPADGARRTAADLAEIAGLDGKQTHVEPVFHDGALLGALVVRKPRGEDLTGVERRLFHDLASQAGLILARFRLVHELRESRARLVAAQDLERRRVERNLHDGAQQRFVNALLALGIANASVASADNRNLIEQAAAEVKAGLDELRILARGLQPPLLVESGLTAAVKALADRTLIEIAVESTAERRYPEGVESTAYFVVAEALANAVKHSQARLVLVSIHDLTGSLHVEVADDGVGGADPGAGSGLIGLRDRVSALGGRLEVRSPSGAGTTVSADLPCV